MFMCVYVGSSKIRGRYIERKRERRTGEGLYIMSDQVEFVGVHREREKKGGGYTYVGSRKVRGCT